MQQWGNPGVDRAITPQHGVSRLGQPLSYNRAPAPDLAPWIARLYATVVEAPADYRLDCGLFNDLSIFRIQLAGDWSAQTRDGTITSANGALFFGPQTRRMPVSVVGSFVSVGLALRPGTGHALIGAKTAQFVDRAVPCEELGLSGQDAIELLQTSDDPEEWLRLLEGLIRQIVTRSGSALPDPLTARFEAMALADPTIGVAEFAQQCGVDQRRLERIVLRDFGLTPKQVLRRARALDMASHLRGVADEAEAEELILRYYDQSHLIREFTQLFGMSPREFVTTSQPIMTLTLESRQARRLEALERLAPGAQRPWE